MILYTVTSAKPYGKQYHGDGSIRHLDLYHYANSIRGMHLAHAKGYAQIDMDLRRTKDGVWVLSHSDDIMGKEGFSAPGVPHLPISKLTWSQVSKLRAKGNYRVLRIERVLKEAKALGLILALDIKQPIGDPGFDALTKLINASGAHVFFKSDPHKPELVASVSRARAHGYWGRYNYTGKYLPPKVAKTVSSPEPIMTTSAPTAYSQNGYSVIFDREDPLLHKWVIPGSSRTFLLRRGSVGFVLAHFLLYFHEVVESLDKEDKQYDDWGWAVRPIRGQTSGYSNHASGSAVDVNATQHGLGTSPESSFTAKQIKAIRSRLKASYMAGAIRWGGDYRGGRKDPMHFESDIKIAAMEKVAKRLMLTPRGRKILKANPDQKAIILS